MRKILTFGSIFKRSSKVLAGLCVLAFLSSSASADLVTFDAMDGGPLDQAGVGATEIGTSSNGLTSVTLTTIDIIGYDGTNFVSTIGGPIHTTNIQASNSAYGVNSASTPPGAGSDSRDFDIGEQWVVSFNEDIELTQIDLGGQSAGEEFQVSSSAFTTLLLQEGQSNDIHNFTNLFVPAGTTITFESVAGTGIRISQFTVDVAAVPEPSSFALLGLASLGMISRRRRR